MPSLPIHDPKIFPSNLTARADFIVRGNPSISRPEDSVGNTIPGLEYDERNLDKYFFPGLVFEFQRSTSTSGVNSSVDYGRPLLRTIEEGVAQAVGLAATDVDYAHLPADRLIHLWAVRSVCGRRFDFFSPAFDDAGVALGCWRAIRDLEPGDVTLLLATSAVRRDETLFQSAVAAWVADGTSRVVREGGALHWAVLTGARLPVLEAGVINPAIPVGELQSTMCTPWQYDFRDCKCYYWAANRPDVVASDRTDEPFEKFLRRDRSAPAVHSTDHEEWLNLNGLNHVAVLDGWESLPVVLDDKEVSYIQADVRQTFRRLATVEHALLVEYLYAYYTLDQSKGTRVEAAARDLLQVAIEEMHHFRWVNEILGILGERPAVDRATDYGSSFDFRAFELAPFDEAKLDWFIRVEQPSQSLNMPAQIDGMYVRLYLIIGQNQAAFPRSSDLLRIVKLLIDEGETHYQAFMAVRHNLASFASYADILRRKKMGPVTVMEQIWLDLSDAAYGALLSLLQATFGLGGKADGRVMQRSIRSMHQMDSFNQQLATRGLFPHFTLPAFVHQPAPSFIGTLADAENRLKEVHERLMAHPPDDPIVPSGAACVHAYFAAINEMCEALRTAGEEGTP
jgi:hypothetical protein